MWYSDTIKPILWETHTKYKKTGHKLWELEFILNKKKANINSQNTVPDVGADTFGEQLPAFDVSTCGLASLAVALALAAR